MRPALPLAVALGLAFPASLPLGAWGGRGHGMVATLSLRTLPPELAAWFKGREDLVAEHATDPDHWKKDRREGPRHYLDADIYGGPAKVPRDPAAAEAAIGTAAYLRHGQAPWVILIRQKLLSDAFRAGDAEQVALQSAWLSHYIADLHVPLHTVAGHDGGTGQKGVHSRWETGLVERGISLDHLKALPAQAESWVYGAPFAWLAESHAQAEAVLASDRAAQGAEAPPAGSRRGEAYWMRFSAAERGRVEDRLEKAAQRCGAAVLAAWRAAGAPEAGGKK